jgi:Domain of unknown function (DUF6468)
MPVMALILDLGLLTLLAATLFHAVRLERALGVLKRDRAALDALVATFNASTRAAEAGVERLRATTDGAGRQIQRQIDSATSLKDDLSFIVQRGEGLADRLDDLIRSARTLSTAPDGPGEPVAALIPFNAHTRPAEQHIGDTPKIRSQAERDLLKALRMAR